MKKTFDPFLSSDEAAAALGVELATLYAYVSRGLLRSEPGPAGSRARRYRREDVERLRLSRDHKRDPAQAARSALDWGRPALDSAITLIEPHAIHYRGRNVAGLAESESFERVAALLWTDNLESELFSGAWPQLAQRLQRMQGLVADAPIIERLQILLALTSTEDPGAQLARSPQRLYAGARILRALALFAGARPAAPQTSIAATLAGGLVPAHVRKTLGGELSARLINAALILCADHELNVSTFTARCVASAGASPYQAVLAGLAALSGPRHGGLSEAAGDLLAEAETQGPRPALIERLRRGDTLPGFGHPLYRDGDPRAKILLGMLKNAQVDAPALKLGRKTIAAARELIEDEPTIDLALAILARTLDLPRGGALTLFAIGRAAGWIAHVLEQHESGALIRLRARYTGSPPRDIV